MTHPGSPASTAHRASMLVPALAAVGFGCLLAITLVHPGGTRMFAWPWSLALAGTLLMPALILIARAANPQRPLVMPPPSWIAACAGTGLVIFAAALFSPHRASSLRWGAPLLSALAVGVVVFDWLHADSSATHRRRAWLWRMILTTLTTVAIASLGLWLAQLKALQPGEWADARNPFPLGHSNYTAGIALLLLPGAVFAGIETHRWRRAFAFTAAGLAVAMLLTSGSRAGVIALGPLAALAIAFSTLPRKIKGALLLSGLLVVALIAVAHPRTRAMLLPADTAAAPNVSNVQRSAMLHAGALMGRDRPWLGWGPGTTPLVYPRYRAQLDGGAENVLQLHSLPVQLWAEFGIAGIAVALALIVVVARNRRHDPLSVITLGGYVVFALFDWQLDVPVFGFVLAALVALAAPAPPAGGSSRRNGPLLLATLACIAVVGLAGRRDPAPPLNARALRMAADRAQAEPAIALLRESLALNADQEIAHFNLGWLLVVRDPAAAERHFESAAQLVPDKGGVYFGLALARLNRGADGPTIARALALECLNDPTFLHSPWWGEPALAAQREATVGEFSRLLSRLQSEIAADTYAGRTLAQLAALAPDLGRVPLGPERSYRRERTGYPVLMRNLNLAPPRDLFDVREPANPPRANLPPKGWLPSPLLLSLLDAPLPESPTPADRKSEIENRK